jgi:putative flippase GtrA
VRGLLRELAAFGVVGGVAYVMTVGVSNLLRFGPPKAGPLTSLGVAMAVAATFSYVANRYWTWRHRRRQGVRREYGLFLLLSLVGFGITEVPVAITEYVLHLHSALAYNVSGNLVGTGIGTVWRFWSFKRWVFLPPVPDVEPPVHGRSEAEPAAQAAHEALV